MTTLLEWVEEVRSRLDGDRSEEANQLAGAYTAGSGTITLRHSLGSIAAGAIVSVGNNTMRVFSVNPVAKTAVVQAGWMGSTDEDAADGDLVRVNPRFTDHRITKELNGALKSLSSPLNGLYKVGSTEVTYDANVLGYELTGLTGLIRVLEVRRDITGPTQSWARLHQGQWDVIRSAPTEDFASGISLQLKMQSPYQAPFSMQGLTVFTLQVVYAAAFTELTDLAADVSTSGIPTTAEDIPPLAAAVRIMSGREVARSALNAQGDARKAQEVPAGSIGQSYRGLQQQLVQRVQEENARLRAQYPLGK